jgi:hypothetical protein
MRAKLKRDIAREEMTRIEEAARTFEDFEGVTKDWDKLDSNRERKERYHERRMTDKMFEWDIFAKRLRTQRDFFDDMFMCICQMHNLVEDPDISRLIEKATDKQKIIFFPRVIVGCSTAKISKCHEMTDRNVRKLIDLMIDNIRIELYGILLERQQSGLLLPIEKRRFLEMYKDTYEQKKTLADSKAEQKALKKAEKKAKKSLVDKNDNE